MAPTAHIDESWFISFYELDPSRQQRCIYFTQYDGNPRCRASSSDNQRAIKLHAEIVLMSTVVTSPMWMTAILDKLRDYILCNCCEFNKAQHRDRMEHGHLLMPLARRWKEEIQRHVFESNPTLPAAPDTSHAETLPVPIPIPVYNHSNLARNQPNPTNNQPNGLHCELAVPTNARVGVALPRSVASLAPPQFGPSTNHQPYTPTTNTIPFVPLSGPAPYQFGSWPPSNHAEFTFGRSEIQPRYDLNHREPNNSTNHFSTQHTSINQASSSEPCPYIADPQPSDSVSSKFLSQFEDREDEKGLVYIFDPEKSPGHVKIGWTALSVGDCLERWSKCGYTPRLLFLMDRVPNAQRVDTLTHHELIKEWRWERKCEVCETRHGELFEVSSERAAQVLGDWAEFFKRYEPHESSGSLKHQWRRVIMSMDEKKLVVTAAKLLEHYASLVEEETLILRPTDPRTPRFQESMEEVATGMGSLRIGQSTQSKETPMLSIEPLNEQIAELETPSPKAPGTQPKSEPTSPTRAVRRPKLIPQRLSRLLRSTRLLQDTPSLEEAKPRTGTGAEIFQSLQLSTTPEASGPTASTSPRHMSEPASDPRAPSVTGISGALHSFSMTLRSMTQRRETLGTRFPRGKPTGIRKELDGLEV
jgi:hypothetical protein